MKKFMISKLRMSGLSAAAVLITILAGCTEKQTVSPEIRPLDSEHVTVGPDGGQCEFHYIIDNPGEYTLDVSLPVDASWISDINTQTPGTVSFIAEANNSESERETVMRLIYGPSSLDVTVTQNAAPILEAISPDIEAEAEGGTFIFKYSISTPVEGCTASADSEAEWISDIDASITGEVSITVAPNETEQPREASVTIDYCGSSLTFRVIQAGAIIDDFKIEITEITEIDSPMGLVPAVCWNVIAKDKEMYYFTSFTNKSTWDLSSTPEEFMQQELSTTIEMAAAFSMSFEDYLINYAKKGDSYNNEGAPLTAGEYVVYAYGVSAEEQSAITGIFYTTFTYPEE